jgi:hypothetical protein
VDNFAKFKQAMVQALGLKRTKSPEEIARNRKMRLSRYAHRNATYPYSSHRQHERYARNRMDEQQRNSHKPGTVQPWHIFGGSNV